MSWLFGRKGKPQAPERVPTDTVIPVGKWDDLPQNRDICIDCTMRFDDVLDAEKLSGALERLLNHGHWRKLGARMRLAADGKLEYHVPAEFTPERPAFFYSHEKFDTGIAAHPLASQIPRASSRPAVLGSILKFRPLFRAPNTPICFEDYALSDKGQLALRIVSFEDATLVTVTWLHTLMDALAFQALLHAWTMVLEGREAEVPQLYGYDFDPLVPLGAKAPEELEEKSVLAPKLMKGQAVISFALRFMSEILFYRDEDTRVVSIPSSYIQALRENAMNELATTAQIADGKPFLSEGDILTAWWTKIATQHHPPTSDRTIMIMNIFGMRNILSKDLLPTKQPYVANCIVALNSFVSVKDLHTKPLSYTASEIRRAIVEQGTRSQIEASTSAAQKALRETGRTPLYGDSTMQMVAFTNWTKGKLFETDFSAAVVKTGLELGKRTNKLGRPSYVNADGYSKWLPLRNTFPIIGKDDGGNYWVRGVMRRSHWDQVEKILDSL